MIFSIFQKVSVMGFLALCFALHSKILCQIFMLVHGRVQYTLQYTFLGRIYRLVSTNTTFFCFIHIIQRAYLDIVLVKANNAHHTIQDLCNNNLAISWSQDRKESFKFQAWCCSIQQIENLQSSPFQGWKWWYRPERVHSFQKIIYLVLQWWNSKALELDISGITNQWNEWKWQDLSVIFFKNHVTFSAQS